MSDLGLYLIHSTGNLTRIPPIRPIIRPELHVYIYSPVGWRIERSFWMTRHSPRCCWSSLYLNTVLWTWDQRVSILNKLGKIHNQNLYGCIWLVDTNRKTWQLVWKHKILFFFFILVINLRKEAYLMFCHYVENLKKKLLYQKDAINHSANERRQRSPQVLVHWTDR